MFIVLRVEAAELRVSAKLADTCRHLPTRVSEHMGISPLTGKKRPNSFLTSILSRHQDANHPVSFEDFKILSSSSFEYELLQHESLLTKTQTVFKPKY